MITSNNVWYYSFEMVKLSAGGVCAITMHFQAFMKALSVLWVIWQVFIMGLFKEYFPKKLERNLHFSRVYLMPRWRLLRSKEGITAVDRCKWTLPYVLMAKIQHCHTCPSHLLTYSLSTCLWRTICLPCISTELLNEFYRIS